MAGAARLPGDGRPVTFAARWPPVALVLAYCLIGMGYVATVPAWEAPDEPWHLAYAEILAQGAAPSPADTYEAHQAPGYYMGLSLVVRAAGLGGGIPRSPGNPYFPWADAAYWHPPGARGEASLSVLRTISGFLAAAAVAVAWAVGRRLAPGDRGVAVLAAAIVALLPQYQHIGHSISNDPLAAVTGGSLVYVGMRIASGPWRRAAPALAAAFVAAAVGKVTAWPVAAATAVGVAFAHTAGVLSRRMAFGILAAGLVGAGAVGLLMATLGPATLRAMLQDASARGGVVRADLVNWRTIGALARETAISTWGRFGWLSVDLPRATAVAAGVLAMTGAFGAAVWLPRAPAPTRRAGLVAIAAMAAVAVAWTKNAVADPQPQGRLLFAAIAAAAAVIALGWRAWLPRGIRGPVCAAVVSLLVVVNGIALTRSIPGAYAPWRRAPAPIALAVLPTPAVVAARLRGSGARAEQTFAVRGEFSDVAVAVHRARGQGTLRLILKDSRGVDLASTSVELGRVRENRWIHVDLPDASGRGSESAGGPNSTVLSRYTLALDISDGAGFVELWGSAEDFYPDGALTLDGLPATDLSLIAQGAE